MTSGSNPAAIALRTPAPPQAQHVQVEASLSYPLLVLEQALPWEALTEVMTRYWRQNGKNVDGGRGLPRDIVLYVPLMMLIKALDSRQMEAYLAEKVVTRRFISLGHEATA